jgi:hypothetical protein
LELLEDSAMEKLKSLSATPLDKFSECRPWCNVPPNQRKRRKHNTDDDNANHKKKKRKTKEQDNNQFGEVAKRMFSSQFIASEGLLVEKKLNPIRPNAKTILIKKRDDHEHDDSMPIVLAASNNTSVFGPAEAVSLEAITISLTIVIPADDGDPLRHLHRVLREHVVVMGKRLANVGRRCEVEIVFLCFDQNDRKHLANLGLVMHHLSVEASFCDRYDVF